LGDLVGRTLGGFRLAALIGEGGFGQVFRAHQEALGREAVVKVRRDPTSNRGVDRFLQEARLASRLDHPYAAHVYAFGAEPDGTLWIAMELVRGTPLDRLVQHAPMSVERAVPFLRRLCEVVQTAHDQGIVHRDLKPANVMVISRAGSVFPKLLDLGVALDQQGAGGADEHRGPIGTPFYMAPEQWVPRAPVGPPADVYALGVIAYELLAGRPPFDGDSVLAVAIQHARARPPALPNGLPAGLGAAIARAMAKRPAERFGSALELATALVEASGLTAEAAPLPGLDEATRTEAMLRAPQPIAEAVAGLDAARNPHQALLAVHAVARAVAQYVGVVALACRTRSGPGRRRDSTRAIDRLRALRRGGLDPTGWWELARELARPFAAIPDAHPIPELVAALTAEHDVLAALLGPLDAGAVPAAEDARRSLAGALPRLAALLGAVRFLYDYRLAVAAGPRVESWMGVRRPQRLEVAIERAPADVRAVLVGGDAQPVVALWPLVQVAAPSPNAPRELFVLAGSVRGTACLVAPPHGFEHLDPDVWSWLGEHLGAIDGEASVAAGDPAAPYLGLRTFEAADAAAFVGREREVEGFVNHLHAVPLVAIVGPSGAGKSSFVRAGVLPALARAGHGRALTLRPGHSPVASLASQLAGLGVGLPAEAIARDPAAVGEALRAYAAREDVRATVVVDQAEELVTLCRDPDERAVFAHAISAAARAVEDPVRVIVALRDDFLVALSALPFFRDRIAASIHVLTTPARDDLVRILVEPARRAGYELEDAALVDEIVDDVIDRPNALALLSFTARQLWELRDRHFRTLPRKAYRALGGVGGALGRHAEDVLAGLSAEQQRLVRIAFRHLVTAEGTRAIVGERDLRAALAAAASDRGVADRALDRLIEARLLVASEGDHGAHQIEVVHEALLEAWPRLAGWRREDADGVRFRDHLRAAAKQWDERGRPAGLLWRGDALLEYRLWRSRFPDPPGAVEVAFAGASEAAAARSRRRLRAAVATVFVAMTGAAIVMWRLGARADAAAVEARQRLTTSLVEQGRRAMLDGDLPGGAVYLSEAYARGADTADVRYLLARAHRSTAGYLRAIPLDRGGDTGLMMLRADGTEIVAATDDAIEVWSVATGASRARIEREVASYTLRVGGDVVTTLPATANGHGVLVWRPDAGTHRILAADRPALDLELTPDGRRLLVLTRTAAMVWDLATVAPIATMPIEAGALDGAISERGDRVAVLTGERQLVVFEASSGNRIAVIRLDAVANLGGFDPDGRRVVTYEFTGACAARVWSVDDPGAPPVTMHGHTQAIMTARLDRDGRRVVTGSRDSTVKIWDAATGALILDFSRHRGVVRDVAFSADGSTVVSMSADRTARVWDTTSGVERAVLAVPDLRSAAIAPDASVVVTSTTSDLKVWRVRNPDLVLELPHPDTIPLAAAFSPDGRLIATEDRRQIVRLWDRATGAMVRELREFDLGDDSHRYWGRAQREQRKIAGFDPSGTRLAAPVGDRIAVWEVASGRRLALLAGHADLVSSARFSADGAVLISAGQKGGTIVWDTTTWEQRATLPSDDVLWYAELSPDGEHAITTGESGATLWRWRTAVVVARFADAERPQSGAFSADGTRVAAIGVVGRLGLWSAADGQPLSAAETGTRNARGVRFVGDGLLATTTNDGLTRIWDARRLVELARFGVGGIGHDGGMDRWIEVSPDGALLATTGSDRIARVWDLAVETRSPAAVAAWVRCTIPLDLVDERLVPRARTPADCAEAGR
jgi:WD40 repeat protein/tRNA A-37 threonylcarbamoyl transferase component Bud32